MATAPPSADAVLVRRLHERDRTAWAELYEEFGPRLRPFAFRLTGNVHDADDLVQETFVRALPRLDRLDPETVDLGPYLFTTLRNLFLKSVERGKRAEPVAEVPEPRAPAPIEDDPERSTLLHRQQEEVRVANARLAPRQRLVLALRELEDRSYAEIGEVVGLKENAVAQLISRARENLRTELRLAQVDPESLPEECRGFLPLLSRHLDGQLRGAQLEQTLSHLEGCERCQDTLLAMEEAQRRYRMLLPPLGADDGQRERIEAELTSAGYWSPHARGALALRGRRAVIAASVALLAVGGGGVGAAVLATGRAPAPLPDVPSATAEPAAATTVAPRERSSAKTIAPANTASTVATKEKPAATTPTAGVTGSTAPTTASKGTEAAPAARPPAPKPKPKPAEAKPPAPSPEPKPPKAKPPASTHPEPNVEPPVVPATTTAPDTTAPTVAITGRPAAQTASSEASFSFRANEAGASFACSRDRGAFAPCSSPAAYHGLAPGAHSFAVRARDPAGNTGSPAVATWTVLPPPDTTAPTVTIVSASPRGSDVTFGFTSSERGSTFGCSLDGGAFDPCTSPRSYSRLAPGGHTFAVRATDAAGNTGGAATHAWTIARPLPDLVVSALTETSFTVTNTGTAAAGPFVVSVTLVGTFTISGLARGQSATRTWSACRRGTLSAIADRGRAVAESNEDNNARSLVSDC